LRTRRPSRAHIAPHSPAIAAEPFTRFLAAEPFAPRPRNISLLRGRAFCQAYVKENFRKFVLIID